MLTTGRVSEILPVEVDNDEVGRSSFEVRPSGIGVESVLSHLAFRSLRARSLAPRRPSSSQRTEVFPKALELDDERAVRPVNTETPDAVEGSKEPLEIIEDGWPAALRVS